MKIARRVLCAIACATVCSTTAVGHEARTQLGVNATVAAVARLELRAVPSGLVVTGADVRRGFVDVDEPTALTVRSNSPEGFALDVTTLAPLCSAIVVHGVEGEQALGADGGTLVQRWQHRNVADLVLQFRLMLAPGVAPGSYPWPMRLAARPL